MEELTNEKALLAGSSRVRAAIRRYLVPRSVPSLRQGRTRRCFICNVPVYRKSEYPRSSPLLLTRSAQLRVTPSEVEAVRRGLGLPAMPIFEKLIGIGKYTDFQHPLKLYQ